MDLIDKLPYFYDNDITKPIIEAEQIERDKLTEEIEDLLRQCFVSTATWGLDYWENMLGISTIKSKSFEERRSIILSKMRGTRTTTIEVMRQIAMSFFGVENVEINEDNDNYLFNIDFQNAKSKVCYMISLCDYIDIYKPAHLNYNFTFTNAGKLIISEKKSGYFEVPICGLYKSKIFIKKNSTVGYAMVGKATVAGGD